MCLAYAVLAAALAKGLSGRRVSALAVGWIGLGVWLLVAGLPAMAVRFYTVENLGLQELEWERGIIESLPGPVLTISNKSTIPFILWHDEVVLNTIAAQKGDDIRYHMGQDTFKEVIVSQAITPDDGTTATMGVDPEDLMPPTFHLQTIAEKRFGGGSTGISRDRLHPPRAARSPRSPGASLRPASPRALDQRAPVR